VKTEFARRSIGAILLAGAGLLHPPAAIGQPQSTQDIPAMLSITAADEGRTVEVRVGESIRIVLPENASTGYRWALEPYDAGLLEAQAGEPHYGGTAIGSGGEVEFVFRARKPGEAAISLKHWRHWEGDASITRRFRIRLVVRPTDER
jgi:inhibitor of cysteine peptidase